MTHSNAIKDVVSFHSTSWHKVTLKPGFSFQTSLIISMIYSYEWLPWSHPGPDSVSPVIHRAERRHGSQSRPSWLWRLGIWSAGRTRSRELLQKVRRKHCDWLRQAVLTVCHAMLTVTGRLWCRRERDRERWCVESSCVSLGLRCGVVRE